MNNIKKLLGIVWIAIGLFAGYYLFVNQALDMWKKGLESAAHIEELVPAIIYTFVLTPIIVGGMSIFGMYCLKGEYSSPQN
jgi:hypothetical protein